MNRIYLFGRVVSKSNLKYEIFPKLKLYIKLTIETISGNLFNCVVKEELLEDITNLKEWDYVYIIGCAKVKDNIVFVRIQQVYVE